MSAGWSVPSRVIWTCLPESPMRTSGGLGRSCFKLLYMILGRDETERYRRDGYLQLDRPILPEEEVLNGRDRIEDLLAGWGTLPTNKARGKRHSKASPPQIAEIRGATALDGELGQLEIVRLCRNLAAELLARRRVWFHFDHVFSKQPSEDSRVLWHQDRAYSLTGMATHAVHIWIPMQTVSEQNGCMSYIPHSHREGLKKHTLSERLGGVVQRCTPVNESRAVACPVHIGGVICHDPMTMHASGPNTSDAVRIAWVLQFGIGPWTAARELARPLQIAVHRRGDQTRRGDLSAVG
jgi:hypothetical protein